MKTYEESNGEPEYLQEKGVTGKEREYEEILKLGENAGIADLMKIYGEYKQLMDMSAQYLQMLNPNFTFSTTDSSTEPPR